MAYEKLLERFAALCREVFGDQLTGVYLHGSMAMGCFRAQKSDIDLIVVAESALTDAQKRLFLQGVLALNREAPEKGLELSVVERRFCNPFVYPTPYEFHFSNAHLELAQNQEAYLRTLQGTDKDLAAHFTILNRYGVTLFGAPVKDVFASVPARDYIDSIWCDVENAAADIADNPVYVTLNLCRVLAYLREGLVVSKRDGGKWGIKNVPQPYCAVVEQALLRYTAGSEIDCEIDCDEETLRAFAQKMLAQIRAAMGRSDFVPLG